MTMDTLFHMWNRFREKLIAEHNFYMEQAKKRLLSQFENLEEESDRYSEEWLAKTSHHFDPDRHDPGDFYEQAYEEGIEFYQMLDDMKSRTRLSVVAGLFHEWDKQVRDWTVREVNHWCRGEEVKKAIWRANFNDIADLFEGLGWEIKSKHFFMSLDKFRLVVNAYKHGDGGAFETIKAQYPEFIRSIGDGSAFSEYADHSDLVVTDQHIEDFSNAVVDFWKDVPEYILDGDHLTVPSWFTKALKKDMGENELAKASK